MKKWLVLILLLVTAAGSFIPCCLIKACAADTVSANTHEDNREGSCSPFSACATCTGFAELANPIQLVMPVAQKQVHYVPKIKFNLTTYASAFWQPPRLV